MRGDFTRLTFRPAKHYSGVRQQQGRVQLDADWNEQADIEAHRDRTTATDVIGPTGAPMDRAGFGLTCEGGDLKTGCHADSIRIGAGRYYVDGILCENDANMPIEDQLDLPGFSLSGTAEDRYLVYLDAWEQHITALEDESIREVALGGPDTATRVRTVWQVKLEGPVTEPCSAFGPGWAPAGAVVDGTMAAQAEQAEQVASDCLVPAGGGYRRLENQLYRVQVLDGRTALAWPRPGDTAAEDATVPDATHVHVTSWVLGGVAWRAGQVVEVFNPTTDAANAVGTVGRVVEADEGGLLLTLDADLSSLVGAADVKVRRVATFVWSRDNGSIAVRLEDIDPVTSILTVSHPNRDVVSGFAPGQWVELSDRERQLRGEPGYLVELGKVQGNELTVKSWPGGTALSLSTDFGEQPTVRRWDPETAPLLLVADQWLDLEGGVQVQFRAGSFRSGDYWTIPARSLTHEVEWAPDPNDPTKPAFLPPEGIGHHFAPLALLDLGVDGVTWTLAEDCRRLFPPLTGLLSFTYLGGDGQEIQPVLTGANPTIPGPLPEHLRVRVSNGQFGVEGARVRFAVQGNLGTVNGLTAAEVSTDADGVAEGTWTLDPDPSHPVQHVEATLLDDAGQPSDLPPIRFTANLSFANEVAFDPRTKKCKTLAQAATVQSAIDRLSILTTLTYAGGDGQEAMPAQGLPQLLQALVSNGCGPLQNAKVHFQAPGNGRVAATLAGLPGSATPTLDVTTGPDGMASCAWRPNPAGPNSQQLVATLQDAAGNPITVPASVRFTANLSVASQVAYTPTCDELGEADTVQKAIDILCTMGDGTEPGVRVNSVTFNGPPSVLLQNDGVFEASKLAGGITVALDAGIDPVLKGKPVVVVTLDLPFPFSQSDQQAWQSPVVIGTLPIALSGTVDAAGSAIMWHPLAPTETWLTDRLSQILAGRHIARVLAHLSVKGNFVWAEGNETANLDGEVFGTAVGGLLAARLPSGDGRRGGDLEMWFFLRPG